uniref:Uncharacterized protein n=1 Tax=Lactuca sativa TaxID=4236 RepID=A0A9R1ULT8_LACSA|nr:hypothetical protein LSAT_V11C800408040 [Lactuca sativa]
MQVINADKLMDDGEYEEILEDMREEGRKFGTTPRSPMKFFNHIASFDASLAAMYSDSHVESTTVSCLELFQVTAPPFRVLKDILDRNPMGSARVPLISTDHAQSKGYIKARSLSEVLHSEALPEPGLNPLECRDVVSYEQYVIDIQNEEADYTPTGFDIYT